MYTNLGFGFAIGCIIIVAEIIYAKMTLSGRTLVFGWGTILLLLAMSAGLSVGTWTMIQTFYYPKTE